MSGPNLGRVTDNSSNERRFVIERRRWGRGGFNVIDNAVPTNSTSYTDSSVVGGITYYYRVRARNPSVFSEYSNEDYDSTALVEVAQLPTATTYVMPIGEELKEDLGKLGISTCENNYPKLRFNDDGNDTVSSQNEWYVATAFNRNTWINSRCISQGLYSERDSALHPGEDWNATRGNGAWPFGDRRAPVYSIANGIVIFNSGECRTDGSDTGRCTNRFPLYKGGFGNTLIIAHKTINGEYVLSLYAHLADPSLLAEGTLVNVGDHIGYIGSTGPSQAYHLHFEIRRAGMLTVNQRTGRVALVEKPDIWPEVIFPDDGPQQQFIAANYQGPSEFLKAQSLVTCAPLIERTCDNIFETVPFNNGNMTPVSAVIRSDGTLKLSVIYTGTSDHLFIFAKNFRSSDCQRHGALFEPITVSHGDEVGIEERAGDHFVRVTNFTSGASGFWQDPFLADWPFGMQLNISNFGYGSPPYDDASSYYYAFPGRCTVQSQLSRSAP